jgi:hypothetical protein
MYKAFGIAAVLVPVCLVLADATTRPTGSELISTTVTAVPATSASTLSAADAIRMHDAAVDSAMQAYVDTVTAADARELAAMQSALKQAMHDGDLDDANRINQQIQDIKGRQPSPGRVTETGPLENDLALGAELAGKKWNFTNLSTGVYALKEGQRIQTPENYRPAVAFRLKVRTDTTDIRLSYAADQIIFNWGTDRNQLRIDGGPVGGQHRLGLGDVPTGQWATIDLVVLPNLMTVYVDGQWRCQWLGDFSGINQPFSVFTGGEGTLQVKSLLVGKPID